MTHDPKPHRGICRSAILALIAAPLPAATITQLDPIVVVSTRTPLGIERISPSVAYIPREEMETWQDRQLTDVIQRQPGMTLWSNGSVGSVASLSIRGTESNHTSLFVDGRRMSPGFGNQYDLGFLTPANAASVEIERGPSSVQYGSSNIGGVIDTRLRSGLDATDPEGALSLELGSHQFAQAGLQALVGNDTAGFSLTTQTLTTDNERPNDDFRQTSVSSRFDWRINDRLQFELLAVGFNNDKQLPGSTLSPTPFDNQKTTSWLLSPGVRFLTDELSVHLFYSRAERYSDIFEMNPAYDLSWAYLGDFPVRNEIDVISDEVNLQIDWSLPGDSLLSFGAVFRNDAISNTNINTYNPLDPAVPYAGSFQQFGAYAQLLWMWSEDTELRAGIRHDNCSDFDNETTGNLMLIHHLRDSGTSLFAKFATSYAPPSAVDLAYDFDTSTPLNAERSLSYEIGVNQSLFDDRVSGSLVVFRNEIDNLLSYEPSTFDTFNVEQATTEGVEASIRWRPVDRWELGAGYTWLRAVSDRLDDPRTGGFIADPADNVPLARRPRHLVQLGASWKPIDELMLGVQAVGQFDREDIDPTTYLQGRAEDFVVVRMVANWQLNDDWTITGRIENLFDEEYSSAAGYPALGRTFYLGAKYSY